LKKKKKREEEEEEENLKILVQTLFIWKSAVGE